MWGMKPHYVAKRIPRKRELKGHILIASYGNYGIVAKRIPRKRELKAEPVRGQ